MATSDLQHRCATIRGQLSQAGLFPAVPEQALGPDAATSTTTWRIAVTPFALTQDQFDFFLQLGPQLLAFYRTLNRLYADSLRGLQPSWVAEYLDRGKPEGLLTYSRMKRFRDQLPAVIRPDIIPTQDGMVITELDSVPGGIGLTACLSHAYSDTFAQHSTPSMLHLELIGGRNGMVRGFASMLQSAQAQHNGCVAILVSEEAKYYRPEMTWLAAQLREQGMPAWCVEPREIRFTEEGLRLQTDSGEQ
ncbi:MAG TPA: hypothetical protein VK901_19435, partial [Nitrospiraceae bacterium]|nr:hypothetical protein [Nitrospiraceae bacterium]